MSPKMPRFRILEKSDADKSRTLRILDTFQDRYNRTPIISIRYLQSGYFLGTSRRYPQTNRTMRAYKYEKAKMRRQLNIRRLKK